MRCINEELIQKYIDGETTEKEKKLISDHISGCEKCRERIEDQRNLASQIKNTINLLQEGSVDVPEFVKPGFRKILVGPVFRGLVYVVSAACIITFIMIMTNRQEMIPEREVIYLYNFESGFDANLTVSQQELVITAIDPDGKLSEYNLD